MNPVPTPEPLFQFQLAPVEDIKPWVDTEGKSSSLSLYALTDGHFKIVAGNEELLKYTPEIMAHWGISDERADYQVACFARDILSKVPAIISPIPPFFENIIRNEVLFRQLRENPAKSSHRLIPSEVLDQLELKKANAAFREVSYQALRWLGERTIWLNYLAAAPNIWLLRVENEVWIQWDNIDKKRDGIDVWTAQSGTYALSVPAFLAECHGFAERLLGTMESRIVNIEQGLVRAQTLVDTASLRNQLLKFKDEFEKCLCGKYEPDISWDEAEKAVRMLAGQPA